MSATSFQRRETGLSLVEMMVALAVSAVVMAGAVTLLVNQQRAFQSGAADRGMQETARAALQEITGNLRMAGFGVDPPLAFDFGFTDNIPMLQAPRISGTNVRINPGYGSCANPVSCRDSATGPDEIVFYSRDPAFGHAIQAVGGTSSISMAGPLNVPLYAGQVLQAMCYGGSMLWAYVTVGAYVAPSQAPTIAVPLANGSGLDFPFQNQTLSDGCFGAGNAWVFKVDRYRYYVDAFDQNGNSLGWGYQSPNRPYLMLDQGLKDQNGVAIRSVIAGDVEDLQFAYEYPAAPITLVGAPPGTAVGTVIPAGAGGIDLAPAAGAPGYGTPATDPSRLDQHPANIRAVVVSVVVRTANADITVGDQTIPAAGNRPDVAGLRGYRRMLFQTSAALRNMDARAPYYPTYSASNGADQLNVGGG